MTKHNSFTLIFDFAKVLIALGGLMLLLGAASNRFVTRSIISDIYRDFYSYTAENPVDILVLGTSHTQYGVNTLRLSRSLNASVYNLAMPAQGIGQTYYTLKDALKHCQPRIAVVGLYFAAQPGILEDREYFAYEQLNAMASWEVKLEYMADLITYRNWFDAAFPIVNEHQNWKEPQVFKNNFFFDLGASTEKNKHYNGFVPGVSVMTDSTLARIETLEVQPLESLPEASKKYLQKIVSLCRSRDVAVVFIQVPLLPQYLEKVDYQSRRTDMAKVLEPLEVLWLDWNTEERGLPATFFQDESSDIGNNHLNIRGANRYTDRLSEALERQMEPQIQSFEGFPRREPHQLHDFFAALTKDELVFLTVKDDASYGWLPHEVEQLERLNLKLMPIGNPGFAYTAVLIGDGRVLWEKRSAKPIERHFAEGELLGSLAMPVEVLLASTPALDSDSRAVINGQEYSLNGRGLNCVVLDLKTNRVVRVDSFDLYGRSLYLEELLSR